MWFFSRESIILNYFVTSLLKLRHLVWNHVMHVQHLIIVPPPRPDACLHPDMQCLLVCCDPCTEFPRFVAFLVLVEVCWSGSDVTPSTGRHGPEEGDDLWRPRWMVAGLFTALISLLLPCNMTSSEVPGDWVPFCDLSSEVTLFIIEGVFDLHWLHNIRSPWHILVLCDCLQSSHRSPILLADKYPEWGYTGYRVTGLTHSNVRWRSFLTQGML